ncbi:hypothetical protein [Streptomyces sp. 8N616]|uniref:hypothetical protein n=1 Tax=Streptomyces sp. 8N616 TaxID=3457414 RepID=UPI003FD3299E
MAESAHYSAATLAEAARGLQHPSLAVTLAYAEACGGDVDLWEKRWHAAAEEIANEPESRGSPVRTEARQAQRDEAGDAAPPPVAISVAHRAQLEAWRPAQALLVVGAASAAIAIVAAIVGFVVGAAVVSD